MIAMARAGALLLLLLSGLTPASADAAAVAEPPPFRFEPATAPLLAGETRLETGPSAGPPEQWFLLNGELNVRNVRQATLTPFLPAPGKASGTAVIVAPGGGFLGIAIGEEGYRVARALADDGIAAFVLKYRILPTPADLATFGREMTAGRTGKPSTMRPPDDTPPMSLADGIAAVGYVRSRAAQFGIDPARIGMMGFSAGAFTTLSVMRAGRPGARPDFVASIYGPLRTFPVPADAPPMFNLIAADDFLLARGTGLVEAYRAAGKSVEFHLLARGGHGFGLGRPGEPTENWLDLFTRWLRTLDPPAAR